jgi:hypothetical protein
LAQIPSFPFGSNVTKAPNTRSTGVARGAGSRILTILRIRRKKPAARKRKRVARTNAAFPYLAGLTLAATLALWAGWQFVIKQPDHSALLAAPGVIPWHLLARVNYTRVNDKTVLQFDDGINALDGKIVKLRGYVTPLDSTRDQRHFILSPKPPTCPYCLPAGPEEMVEVYGEQPVKYSFDPITLFGSFGIRHAEDSGFFYRMVSAKPVSQDDQH